MSPSYEYQENPWLAHYKRERRISFKAIAWMVLTVVGIYNQLMKQRKKVTILYGTETGKSKKFSKQAVNLFASLYRCTRVTKSENFPDSKIFVAKTFRIKRVNRVNFQIRDKCA